MPKALPPAIRRKIIDFDPAAPDAVTISQFCQNLGIPRRVFYTIRQRLLEESTAALHPHSSVPITIHRRYDQDTTRELFRLRSKLKNASWDYGPISIRYEAIDEGVLLDNLPSVATIARLLRAAGVVESNPKKRPKTSLVRFQRSHAMALWQLDAFEFWLYGQPATKITIYQLLDDATRFDVGTRCCADPENSLDAATVVRAAITDYGVPQELLSDNSAAFNQLRQGTIGALEAYVASVGCLQISSRPSHPQAQDKNERSHRTLLRYLRVQRPRTLGEAAQLIEDFRHHYNTKRPHQALPGHITPFQAWELIEHTPADTPLDPTILAGRAAHYRRRREAESDYYRQPEPAPADAVPQQSIDNDDGTEEVDTVKVTRENSVIFYQGMRIGVPRTLAGGLFYRTISPEELCLWDQTTGELVLKIPLPVVAKAKSRKFINSYQIKGVYLAEPTPTRTKRHAEFWDRLNNID